MEVTVLTKNKKNRSEQTEYARGFDLSPDDLEVDKNYAEKNTINKKDLMEREKGNQNQLR